MSQSVVSVRVPERRPLSLIVIAVALLGLGVLLTPSVLIALGPMRGSLQHENPLVRRTTLLEVNVIRAMCFAGAVVLGLVALRWRAFRDSRFVGSVVNHPVDDAMVRPGPLVGPSLFVMLAALTLWVAYVMVGRRVLGDKAIGVINREDGVIEGGTVLFFLAASVGSAILAFRTRSKARKVFCGILAVGFFMCGGEEMSWGQHLFGWEAPEAITKVNVQGETNLHNLSGYFADHVFIAGTLFFGGVLPFVAARSAVWRRVFDRFGLLVGSLGLAVGLILVTLNQPYVIDRLKERDVKTRNWVRVQEGREMLSALGYCLLVFESLRKERRTAGAAERELAVPPTAEAVTTTR
jgi:hypothetical protein